MMDRMLVVWCARNGATVLIRTVPLATWMFVYWGRTVEHTKQKTPIGKHAAEPQSGDGSLV